jgi:hypothetical protein
MIIVQGEWTGQGVAGGVGSRKLPGGLWVSQLQVLDDGEP